MGKIRAWVRVSKCGFRTETWTGSAEMVPREVCSPYTWRLIRGLWDRSLLPWITLWRDQWTSNACTAMRSSAPFDLNTYYLTLKQSNESYETVNKYGILFSNEFRNTGALIILFKKKSLVKFTFRLNYSFALSFIILTFLVFKIFLILIIYILILIFTFCNFYNF